ncbi:MAG TPA: Sec-independent protein translocase protein TatB [Acidimicrobiales bacterium]|nr:Sec-independent protein translocase protein TatB [Acidimicrobiales bacterium]
MLNVGTGELLVVLFVALVVLGPDKLPQAARKVGQVVSEVRKVSSGFQAELRDAMKEPVQGNPTIERSPTPMATPPPVAGSERDAADPTLAPPEPVVDDGHGDDADGEADPSSAGATDRDARRSD